MYRIPQFYESKINRIKKEKDRNQESYLFISNEGFDTLDFLNEGEYKDYENNLGRRTKFLFDVGYLPGSKNAVSHTLRLLEKKNNDIKHLMFSDQTPNKQFVDSDLYGHSKGI